MKISILCLLPCGIAAVGNLRHSYTVDSSHDELQRQDDARNGTVASIVPAPYVLELHNMKGVQYTAPVSLNSQTLMAVYDTGSFEVMAVSRHCKVCKLPPGLKTYDNRVSKTFVGGSGNNENHHFAGGTVVGHQDYETVSVGPTNSVFKVDKMSFWQVVDTDMLIWTNQKASFTAIVGLGHRSEIPDAAKEAKKPMDSLIERTGTQRFAICLMRGPHNPGYITFNPSYDVGTNNMFQRISVIGKHHWAVKMNSVSAVHDDKTTQACVNGKPCVAIIDSGTSLIGVPPSAVNMVYDIIKQVKSDCSNLDTLPKLVFELDGRKFSMPGAAYTVQFGPKDGKPTRCLPAFTDFAMTSSQGTVWILGMPFLRHFYTVFDRQEPAIYVADQGDNCEPAPALAANNAQGSFFNSSGLAAGMRQHNMQPAIADLDEATLPSWAYGQDFLTI